MSIYVINICFNMYRKKVFIWILILMPLLFCGACRHREEHVVLHASLIQVFDNFSEKGKIVAGNDSRKIHMVFRIFNYTNDSLYIPVFTLGGTNKSIVYYWINGKKSYSYATIYCNRKCKDFHILPPHVFIFLGINVYEQDLPNSHVSLDSLRRNIVLKYVVDDTDREKYNFVIPRIIFTTSDRHVHYFYEAPGRASPF